jgi:hypothetical protein
MDEHEWLAERFEANRAQLRAVGYRMLSSLSDADVAVQRHGFRPQARAQSEPYRAQAGRSVGTHRKCHSRRPNRVALGPLLRRRVG